jgi:hypothetical protein
MEFSFCAALNYSKKVYTLLPPYQIMQPHIPEAEE